MADRARPDARAAMDRGSRFANRGAGAGSGSARKPRADMEGRGRSVGGSVGWGACISRVDDRVVPAETFRCGHTLSDTAAERHYHAVRPGSSTNVAISGWADAGVCGRLRRKGIPMGPGPLHAFIAQQLDRTEGAQFPFWSPDGQSIGFFAEAKLKKIALSGKPPQTICDVPTLPQGGSWNRDGVILFSAAVPGRD